MSSNWQHKVQQHEAVPPQGAWNNIAGMLDKDDALTTGFASRLAAFEAPAPLDTQKNIFDLLDAAGGDSFEERLYKYETVAPAAVWPQIVTELDKAAAKIISFEPRTRKTATAFFRVAAAIVFIALLSVTVWLLKPGTGANEVAVKTKTQNPATATTKESTTTSNLTATTTPKTQHAADVTAATASTKETNKASEKNITGPGYVENTEVITLAQNPASGHAEKLQNSNGETPQDITLVSNSTANTYITIAGPDGQSVRVSSKLAALVSYLSDNNPDTQENIEIIIKESAKWRATFSIWRDKMTNNNIAPSLTNFMDIIELSNVLEEKK